MTIYEDLAKLKLHYLSDNLDEFLTRAAQAKMTPKAMVEKMTELELSEKDRRAFEWRQSEAKLGKFKQLSHFDWSWPAEIDRKKIEELMLLEFVREAHNVFLAGPVGAGKTMIAKNLGWQSILSGYNVFFTTAAKLSLDLGKQDSSAALARRLRRYERPTLLIIDEIGYNTFDSKAADFLFEIVNRRYEKVSIIMTTNLAFKDWHKVFPGSPCVTAMIDRMTHKAEIVKIDAESYRFKESSETKTEKTSKKKVKENEQNAPLN